MEVNGKKIFVGLSGGVDSAVSAALLLKAGAQVTGVFIKGWYPEGMPCTWAEDRRDAMRVAARLHIPFITLDASAAYKRSVIEYLLAEYQAGRTPNPDILCNRDIKFGIFYKFAKDHGAHAIATGHYRTGEKDQSYFLWAVQKEVLAETVFPVGHMEKEHVRDLAKRFDLPVAEKKDSQGICFLGSISVADFLEKEIGVQSGLAKDRGGKTVGEHPGALLSTIGQKVVLHDSETKGPIEGPWYVLEKDIAQNVLIVAHESDAHSTTSPITFDSANWHGDPSKVTVAQYRYRGPFVRGRVLGDQFHFEGSLPDVPAPGQSLVFYAGKELVGGGVIEGGK